MANGERQGEPSTLYGLPLHMRGITITIILTAPCFRYWSLSTQPGTHPIRQKLIMFLKAEKDSRINEDTVL